MSCFFASSQCLIIHYSEPTFAKHRGIARKHLFPNLVSFRQIVYRLCFNSTALPALRNQRLAQRRYRAPSASACRIAFASAAHRAACQACLCLATPWLVPGSERAWSALSPNVRSVIHRARSQEVASEFEVVELKAFTSKLSQPSSRAHVFAACPD